MLYYSIDYINILSQIKGFDKMKNDVVLLEYFDRNTDDTLLLGFFSKNKLSETIDFYKTLSGFSSKTGDYIYKDNFLIEGNIVYFLQIWKVSEESIICRKVYDSNSAAQSGLNEFCEYTDNPIYDWTIDKYTVDERCWAEGFVTL